MLEMLVPVMSSKHGPSVQLYHHIFHLYVDIMLVFKAQCLAMTLMHPVLCLWWNKGNTDWVQAKVLKLIYCRVCYMMIVVAMVYVWLL